MQNYRYSALEKQPPSLFTKKNKAGDNDDDDSLPKHLLVIADYVAKSRGKSTFLGLALCLALSALRAHGRVCGAICRAFAWSLGGLVQRELCVAIALSDFAACEDAASNEKAEVHHAGR